MSSTSPKSLESSTSVKTPPTSSGEVLYLREDDELQSDSVASYRYLRNAESEEIKRLPKNRRQASEISKLKADSNESPANLKAQLREYHRKMDSFDSERQALMKRIEYLTEQKEHHSTFRGQIAYILSHQVTFLCILAIPCGAYLYFNMVSENHILREQNAVLTKENYRKASEIDRCEIKLDGVNSENLLFRDQIDFANQQIEFFQSEMRKMSADFKEKDNQAMTIRWMESESHKEGMNSLVRCLRDQDNASEKFTGINLFWGLVQVGYTTKSGLDNCLIMLEAAGYRPQIA